MNRWPEKARAWAAEFDRRLAAGAPKKWMRGKWGVAGEWQIKDDKGAYWRRNTQACCGCGHNRQVDYRGAEFTSGGRERFGPTWKGHKH